MFHVEHLPKTRVCPQKGYRLNSLAIVPRGTIEGSLNAIPKCSTWNIRQINPPLRLPRIPHNSLPKCSTWNILSNQVSNCAARVHRNTRKSREKVPENQ